MTQQIQIAIIAQTETVASPNEAAAHTREVELEIGVEHQTLVQLRAELDHQWAIVDRVEFPCDHKESLEAFRHTRELRVASESTINFGSQDCGNQDQKSYAPTFQPWRILRDSVAADILVQSERT